MHSLLERLRAALAPDYQVERELGAGGMGRVFLARDVPLDRPVAIKVLRPELATAAAVERFLREARILASVDHPNIVAVHRAGEAAGLCYFVMEYLRGAPLSERLERGRVPTAEVVGMAADVLSALEAAHARGIIHRDLKPANIFVEGSRTVVVDFGLAKTAAIPSSTTTAVGVGTPAYLPPEQAAGGSVSARTDVYAAGAVIYEALSGRRWSAMPSTDEADWSSVPAAVVPVLKRALAWSPVERWADARSLREAFSAATTAHETLLPDRRLAAVMFMDMEGYTALMGADEHAARAARARIRAAVDVSIPAHSGQLLQYLGDGCLSIFPSAVEAVFAALEVQRLLQTAPALPLRIGIHQGEIAFDEQGAYSDAVNVAARIQALAPAGTVFVSGKVFEEIRNQPELRTTPVGRFRLKNVARRVHVYAVAAARPDDIPRPGPEPGPPNVRALIRLLIVVAASLYVGARPPAPPAPLPPSPPNYDVAIFPLDHPGAPDTLLGQNIAQIAALNLYAVPESAVPSHHVFRWLHEERERAGGAPRDPHHDLGTRHVLRGFVSVQGGEAIVQAVLEGTRGQKKADIYFRGLLEARALGDSLTLHVLRKLRPDVQRLGSRLAGRSADAVRPFLLGNLAFMRDDWATAEAHYLTAIEQDATFGLAWWQLAITQKWLPGRPKLDLIRLTQADTISLTAIDHDLIRADGTPPGTARLRAFDSVRERHPEDALAALLHGDELFHRGAFFGIGLESAVGVLLEAADRDKHFSPPLEHAVWALIRLGHEAEAEDALERLKAAAGPAALSDPAGQPALITLAFALRFRAADVDSAKSMLFELPDTMRVFVARVGLSLGLPEPQLAFGEALFRARGTPKRMRGSGAVAQALALFATGRALPAIAWFDSAAALLGSEARLQAAQWRLVPRTVGWDVVPKAELEAARKRLEGEWSEAPRAQWTLAIDALAAGDLAAAALWKSRLRAASRQPQASDADRSSIDAFVKFIEACEAAARHDYQQAILLSDSLREYAVQRRERDPFFRAVLHLNRGSWYEQLDSLHAADREWLWSENNDIAGWLDSAAEAAEIDWVFAAYSGYRRSMAALRAKPPLIRLACLLLARADALWRKAEQPSARLLQYARGRVGACDL